MINKLRRRIILINMLLVGGVILIVITAVNINNYTDSIRMLERSMNQVLDKNGHDSPPEGMLPRDDSTDEALPEDIKKFEKRGSDDDSPMQISSYIIVTVDSDGNITDTQENNVTMDEDDLEACVEAALKSGGKSGQIPEYSLMYVYSDFMGQQKLIFASNSSVFSSLRSSLLISGLLFLGSLAVIFLISLLLSGLAVKPVKKAWEQQKQFVADASHELKTPLTVILANNNIMMSHKDAQVRDEQQWLESTQEEANHMKQLIEQMLFLAKSDAGNTQVQLSDADLSEIAEGAALNFEPVAFEKDMMIDTDITPGIILRANTTQLNQLVHILIDNAVKYGDNGTTVTIRLRRKNDRAELSVNNFGNVISKEDLEHIFDRFYRAEKSRTTKGYGLGLSIAQRIAQSMNGKLTAESSEESGTTFTADLKIG